MQASFVFVAVLLLQLTVCVQSWGKNGHMIVAQIAADLLLDNSKQIVSQFLGDSSLADIAPLPDTYDHVSQGRWSSPCHYVNIPRQADNFQWSDCPVFCVVQSINNYTRILKTQVSKPTPCNLDQEDGVEPCALEFLTHFIGDIHQPLHVGYGDDDGGNKVKVLFFGQKENLHAVWDDYIIAKWQDDWKSAVQELEALMKSNPITVQQLVEVTDPIAWANESIAFDLTTVYNFTTNSDGEGVLDQTYYDDNLPVVKWRLIAGGVRLAAHLNTVFSSLPSSYYDNDVNNETPIVSSKNYIPRPPRLNQHPKKTLSAKFN